MRVSLLMAAAAALMLAPATLRGEEGHHHTAPHGGLLVELGEHFANLEFVLDAEAGKLTAYAFDGCVEESVRLAQESIAVTITPKGDDAEAVELVLEGVESALTGEKKGDTSQFEASHAVLKGLKAFHGKIATVEILGQTFENVEFEFTAKGEAEKPATEE